MIFRYLAASFLLGAGMFAVQADEPALRTSARMLFKDPHMTRPGQCVAYREGGSGWIMTDPVYFVQGTVVASEVRTRRMEVCPEVAGKPVEQYNREEFVRLAQAQPCVSRADLAKEVQVGMVRLRVAEWDTPHARRAANAGRLFQGQFLNTPLKKGGELEMEADLLTTCSE